MDSPTDGAPGPTGSMPQTTPDAPPTLPSRTAFLVAFTSIVVAGLFGGIIGYGLGDIGADDGGGLQALLWAVIGAAVAAVGVGIVAVLVLRAQAEWRRVPPPAAHPPSPPAPHDLPDGRPEG